MSEFKKLQKTTEDQIKKHPFIGFIAVLIILVPYFSYLSYMFSLISENVKVFEALVLTYFGYRYFMFGWSYGVLLLFGLGML